MNTVINGAAANPDKAAWFEDQQSNSGQHHGEGGQMISHQVRRYHDLRSKPQHLIYLRDISCKPAIRPSNLLNSACVASLLVASLTAGASCPWFQPVFAENLCIIVSISCVWHILITSTPITTAKASGCSCAFLAAYPHQPAFALRQILRE